MDVVKSRNIVLFGIAVLVCAVMALPVRAFAQDAADTKAYKIGVVNRKVIFDEYGKTKKEYEQLQAEVEKRQVTVTELSNKIDAQKTEYDKKKDSMSAAEREEFEAQVESDYRHYKNEMDRLQREVDGEELRVVKKLFGEIDRAIAEVGQAGNYHLVVDGTPKDTPGSIIYSSPTLDMTQKVVEYINSHDMTEKSAPESSAAAKPAPAKPAPEKKQ
jgi:Skp family chaperone for outer membrane proteins